MILDTTYTNKEQGILINDLVGKPYSFIRSVKMKGIGSKRTIIGDVSQNMKDYLNTAADINYANLELRPLGVLVRINRGLKNFTWIIPFYQLVIYRTNGISIHAHGQFIRFKNNRTFKENKSFFNKLLDYKMKYVAQYNFAHIQ
ncbi:MAG: hypothetical protein WBM77_16685 [Maribacter sp.]